MNSRKRITLVGVAVAALLGVALYYKLARNPLVNVPNDSEESHTVQRNDPPATGAPVHLVKAHPHAPIRGATAGPLPTDEIHSSIAKAAHDWAALAARAKAGDSDAAMQLYKGLHFCADAPRNQSDLNKRAKLAEANYGKDSDDYREMMSAANSSMLDCAVFNDAQLSGTRSWLAMAAKNGDTKAQLFYIEGGGPSEAIEGEHYTDALTEYQIEAKGYLDSQINAGNVDALFSASIAYAKNDIFTPDIEKQYAYLFAFVQARGDDSGVFFDGLAQLQGRMPQELANQATQEGLSIYKQCCVRH